MPLMMMEGPDVRLRWNAAEDAPKQAFQNYTPGKYPEITQLAFWQIMRRRNCFFVGKM